MQFVCGVTVATSSDTTPSAVIITHSSNCVDAVGVYNEETLVACDVDRCTLQNDDDREFVVVFTSKTPLGRESATPVIFLPSTASYFIAANVVPVGVTTYVL